MKPPRIPDPSRPDSPEYAAALELPCRISFVIQEEDRKKFLLKRLGPFMIERQRAGEVSLWDLGEGTPGSRKEFGYTLTFIPSKKGSSTLVGSAFKRILAEHKGALRKPDASTRQTYDYELKRFRGPEGLRLYRMFSAIDTSLFLDLLKLERSRSGSRMISLAAFVLVINSFGLWRDFAGTSRSWVDFLKQNDERDLGSLDRTAREVFREDPGLSKAIRRWARGQWGDLKDTMRRYEDCLTGLADLHRRKVAYPPEYSLDFNVCRNYVHLHCQRFGVETPGEILFYRLALLATSS